MIYRACPTVKYLGSGLVSLNISNFNTLKQKSYFTPLSCGKWSSQRQEKITGCLCRFLAWLSYTLRAEYGVPRLVQTTTPCGAERTQPMSNSVWEDLTGHKHTTGFRSSEINLWITAVWRSTQTSMIYNQGSYGATGIFYIKVN